MIVRDLFSSSLYTTLDETRRRWVRRICLGFVLLCAAAGTVLVFFVSLVTSKFIGQIKRDAREKELLLREVHHRVNNNLQIVSSILNLQRDPEKPESEKVIVRSQNRILALSGAHDTIHQPGGFGGVSMDQYIPYLIGHLGENRDIGGTGIRLLSRSAEITLSPDRGTTVRITFPRGASGT